MKTWVRKTLSVGVLAAGALLFAPGAAHADVRQTTGDNNGFLNGTQLVAPISVPVNVVGNSLGILGEANATGVGVNRTESGSASQLTGDNNGIANGTQAYLPISVPLNVVGNSAAVLGEANSSGVGANSVHGRKAESGHRTEGFWPGAGGGQSTGDNNGFLNGTQIYAPIDVPINVCGNSLALLGEANSSAICANGIGGDHGRFRRGHHRESAKVTESAWQSTGDNNGILNGTQLYAPISLPVNLAGNSGALLGVANSHAVAVNRVKESAQGGWGGQSTGDNNGILNGTQLAVPISVPINVCGNALGVLGAANASAGCANGVGFFDNDGGNGGGNGDDGDWIQDGHGGLGHGHGHGHGNGHGQLAGDNGANNGGGGDYLGDNGHKGNGHGNANGDNGYGGTKPAGNGPTGNGPTGNGPTGNGPTGNNNGDNGYGGTKPAGTKPAGTKPAGNGGYHGTKPAATGSNSSSTGGRDRSAEASPVGNLSDTVGGMGDTSGLGGLGLLNTLR